MEAGMTRATIQIFDKMIPYAGPIVCDFFIENTLRASGISTFSPFMQRESFRMRTGMALASLQRIQVTHWRAFMVRSLSIGVEGAPPAEQPSRQFFFSIPGHRLALNAVGREGLHPAGRSRYPFTVGCKGAL